MAAAGLDCSRLPSCSGRRQPALQGPTSRAPVERKQPIQPPPPPAAPFLSTPAQELHPKYAHGVTMTRNASHTDLGKGELAFTARLRFHEEPRGKLIPINHLNLAGKKERFCCTRRKPEPNQGQIPGTGRCTRVALRVLRLSSDHTGGWLPLGSLYDRNLPSRRLRGPFRGAWNSGSERDAAVEQTPGIPFSMELRTGHTGSPRLNDNGTQHPS